MLVPIQYDQKSWRHSYVRDYKIIGYLQNLMVFMVAENVGLQSSCVRYVNGHIDCQCDWISCHKFGKNRVFLRCGYGCVFSCLSDLGWIVGRVRIPRRSLASHRDLRKIKLSSFKVQHQFIFVRYVHCASKLISRLTPTNNNYILLHIYQIYCFKTTTKAWFGLLKFIVKDHWMNLIRK